jgi:2-polyprenyl-3-methyl-5-hydroxy-6-metoxy-1,4-benzoquinol methylase
MIYETTKICRICFSSHLEEILNLGAQPPANSLTGPEDSTPAYVPLRLMFCKECKTVQIGESVSPEYLFSKYLWVTGTSETALKYSEKFTKKALKYTTDKKPFIVEVASNDGTFLKQFQNSGCKVLGVDPAKNISEIASKNGIPTHVDFFNRDLAKKLLSKHKSADIVYARNVIPHVKEIHSVIDGIKTLMDDDGIGIIEFHNAGLLLEQLHYDYIYHEHLFYYTLSSIDYLLNMHGLYIFDTLESPISGGSWVVYFTKEQRDKTEALKESQRHDLLQQNSQYKKWLEFSVNTKKHADKLSSIVKKEVSNSGKIIAYGASARSSTLLNYCGLNSEQISVVIDKNPLKQGLLTAGSNIPIVSCQDGVRLVKEVDVILILAWNFKDEIIDELVASGYKGKFIIPLPGDPKKI